MNFYFKIYGRSIDKEAKNFKKYESALCRGNSVSTTAAKKKWILQFGVEHSFFARKYPFEMIGKMISTSIGEQEKSSLRPK